MKKRSIISVLVLLVLAMPLFAQTQNPASDFEYRLNQAGNGVVITKYIGKSTNVIIPVEIEGFPVMEIEGATGSGYFLSGGAFRCSKITSVVFPNSKIYIGERAFQESSLTHVTIPETINGIGEYAFSECQELTSVTINMSVSNPEFNPRGIFSRCIKLTTVTFTSPWVTIPREMFEVCINLTTVAFPKNLKYIRASAFEDCRLPSITLSEGLEIIGSRAFYIRENDTRVGGISDSEWKLVFGNNRMELLTIPEGVITIEWDAFRNRKIANLILPSSLRNIDSGVFRYSEITELTISNKLERINFGSPQTSFSDNKLNLQSQAALRRIGYTGNF